MTDLVSFDQALLDERAARSQRQRAHHQHVLRECFKHKLKHIADDTEAMTDYCREMIRAGYDVSEELEHAETIIKAELLAVKVLQRERA